MQIKRFMLFILIIVVIFSIFGYSVNQNKKVPFLHAQEGQITVDCNNLVDSPYLLTGEWRIYHGLYTPSELEGRHYSFLDDIRYVHKLAGSTYSLELNVSNFDGYYIMMPEPNGCRLWVNSEEVKTDNKKVILFDSLALPSGDSNTQIFHVVFQVSAFGGLEFNYQVPLLGTGKQLHKVQVYSLVDSVFSLGVVFMLLINVITLFIQKRSEKYLLFFAGAVFISFIIIPNTTPYIRTNWAMFTIPVPDELRLVVTDFLRYFRSFLRINILFMIFPTAVPQKYIRVFNYSITYLILTQVVISILFPGTAKVIAYLFMLLYFIDGWIIIYAFFKSYKTSTILLIGFSIFIGSIILNYILISIGLVPHHAFNIPLLQNLRTGILVYFLAIAVAINRVFAQKYSQADDLATDLEQKVIEKTAAIQASQEQIIMMQQKKRDFITGIVHNLNSSLFTLGGYIEILKDEFKIESRDAKAYLNRIDAKVDYIKKMAADMFLMERLDDGNIQMKQYQFDLAVLCSDIIKDPPMQTKDKQLTFSINSNLQTAYFFGDRFYLQQAIENIVSNAVRHSKENGIIEFSLDVVDDTYHLAISDNGTGISEKDLPHIFERYYTKKEAGYASTGLGLTISQEIIHKLGGTISVKSTLGEGTIFTIHLPIGHKHASGS